MRPRCRTQRSLSRLARTSCLTPSRAEGPASVGRGVAVSGRMVRDHQPSGQGCCAINAEVCMHRFGLYSTTAAGGGYAWAWLACDQEHGWSVPRVRLTRLRSSNLCKECGAAVALRCSSCGAGHEPGQRFCSECGTALAAASAAARRVGVVRGPGVGVGAAVGVGVVRGSREFHDVV